MLQKLMLAAGLGLMPGQHFPIAAQQPAGGASSAAATKQHFLILLRPARAGFIESPTPAEQKAMGEHFAYLKKLTADGKVILGGPSINGDKTFGIVVLEVGSEAEARTVLEGDPSVKGGVMKGELAPFTLALMRGR